MLIYEFGLRLTYLLVCINPVPFAHHGPAFQMSAGLQHQHILECTGSCALDCCTFQCLPFQLYADTVFDRWIGILLE